LRTRRSQNLKRGATEGEGNTGPEERVFLRSKTSKSRGTADGSRFRPVSVRCFNDKGGRSLRRGETAGEGKKPLNRNEPWTWLWDEIDPRANSAGETVERLRKPEGGP